MKILIAEDHDMTAEILMLYLQKQGFEAVVAANGREALACLDANHDVGMIISDLMMPEMDGFELLGELRKHVEWSGLPVIIISALADPEVVRQAAALGCRRFIVKPISATEIVKAVRGVLNEEPETLRAPLRVITDLGVDREIYDRLIHRFEQVARDAAKMLQDSLETGTPPAMPLDHNDVRRIIESAKLLGAERVAALEHWLFCRDGWDESIPDVTRIRLVLRELTLALAAIRTTASPSQAWKGSFSTLTTEDRRERSVTTTQSRNLRKRTTRV